MEERMIYMDGLDRAFADLGITLNELQKKQFTRYAELLVEWNKVMNLTAITEYPMIAVKHFEDSCALFLEKERFPVAGKSLIDVGTGAGFPGLPLKILFPELKLTLLDSLAKRIHFLDTVVAELGLSDVQTIHSRAEDGARKTELREQFDYAVSRAVANMAVLSEYCLPYVKQGGVFIAFKSGEIREEAAQAAAAIRTLGGGRAAIRDYILPGTDFARSLVFVKKENHTPKAFPRKAGTAAKNPLH